MTVLRIVGAATLAVVLAAAPAGAQTASREDEAGGSAAAAGERLGLGGDPGLPADAIVPFRAGVAGTLDFEASVQNLGDTRVGLAVRAEGPGGVVVALADTAPPSLAPGEQRAIPLVLRVGDDLPVGDHTVRFAIAPTPYSGPVAGVSYAPALGGRVVVRVSGAEAKVRVVAQDVLLDEPTEQGRVSLYALQPDAEPLLLESVDAEALERRVVPGAFRAAFERPAVEPDAPPVRTTVDFALPDGADETVVLDVVGFRVATLDVTPGVDAAGDLVHADVDVTLENRLEALRRPMVLELEVRRDGRLVEVLELGRVVSLPTGVTTTSNRYRPPDGFVPGEWQFDVRLASGWFGTGPTAPARLAVDPAGDGPGAINPGLVATVGVLFVLAVGVGAVRRPSRRRRRAA